MLVRALLWRIFDEVKLFSVPEKIFRMVKNAYQDLGDRCRLPEGDNPVEKVPLIVTGSDAEVHIDVLLEDDGIEDDRNPTGGGGTRLLRPRQVDSEQLRHMKTLLVGLIRCISYLRSEFTKIHERHERLLTVLNRNITHMMRNTVHRMQRKQDLKAIDNDAVEGDITEE